MRTCSSDLAADINSECTSLCRLWTVTRADGFVLQFTDCSKPVTFDSDVYRADLSFITSAIFTSASYAKAQSVTMDVPTATGGFTQDDLRQKLYRGATCKVSVINYIVPAHGEMVLFEGVFGKQSVSDKGVARFEITPKGSSFAGGSIGREVYSFQCRNSFGDVNCSQGGTVDLGVLSVSFTVDAVSGSIVTAGEFTGHAANYWTPGYLLWDTGNNAGTRTKIQASATDHVTVVSLPARAIQIGDTGTITPGCDLLIETCFAKWANQENFRGEPDVPDIAFLPLTPVTSST